MASPSTDHTQPDPSPPLQRCLTMATSFVKTPPFCPQLFRPNDAFRALTAVPSAAACNFGVSICSTMERCFRLIHSLASQNLILKKLFSLSSELHDFVQVQRRNYWSLNSLSEHNFAAVLPGDSVAGIVVANGILNFLNIYNTVLIVRLVLTWFPNTPPAIVSPLSTICDPYLNIFRGIIPPLGGTLDLSPILAFLALNAFTSTAAALPAELPPPGESQRSGLSHPTISDLTSSQKKWSRRLQGKRSSITSNAN